MHLQFWKIGKVNSDHDLDLVAAGDSFWSFVFGHAFVLSLSWLYCMQYVIVCYGRLKLLSDHRLPIPTCSNTFLYCYIILCNSKIALSSLVQWIACGLFGIKPLHDTMMSIICINSCMNCLEQISLWKVKSMVTMSNNIWPWAFRRDNAAPSVLGWYMSKMTEFEDIIALP